MHLCLTIGSMSFGGIMRLSAQIPRIYVTLMGYWIAGQVRTRMMSVMCKINFRMGENILRRVLVIPFAVFLRPN